MLRIRRTLRRLAPVVLTVPLTFAVPVVDDTSYTRVRVGGGGGQYTFSFIDCAGNPVESHDRKFRDAGVEIEHVFGNKMGVGVRGGYLDDSRLFYETDAYGSPSSLANDNSYYVQPYLLVGGDRAGWSVGLVHSNRPLLDSEQDVDDVDYTLLPSFAVRIGDPRELYMTAEFMNSFPLYSGGGALTAGFGYPIGAGGLWFGGSFGTGLYSRGGFLVRGAIPVGPHWSVELNARMGHEFGFGGALGYRIFHPRP